MNKPDYSKYNNVVVVYHSVDPDGWSSAWVVSKALTVQSFIGYNYGNSVDKLMAKIPSYTDLIVVVDLSMSNELVPPLVAHGADLIWFDHHESSIMYQLEHSQYAAIPGIRLMGEAGVSLTWKWFFPDVELPYVLLMVDRYDVKDITYLPEIDIFNLMFRGGYKLRPLDSDWHLWDVWTKLTKDDMIDNMDKWVNIYHYQKQQHAIMVKQSREVTIQGHNVLVCNVYNVGSNFFDSKVKPGIHDATINYYQIYNGRWRYTVYAVSEHFNSRVFAETYGGGGHAGAAGFFTDELLEELK